MSTPIDVPGVTLPSKVSTLVFSRIAGLADIENAVGAGLLRRWEELLDLDPFATFFQGPIWCMEWYRAYSATYVPFLIVAQSGGEVVGLAAMASQGATGELVFAGAGMADYRDVLALPEHRESMLREFLRVYRTGKYPNVFHFGSTVPEAPSVDILLRLSGETGVPMIRRYFFGWRWWPQEAKEDPFKSRSVKYKMNCIRRRGEVSADVVRTDAEWDALKQEFYLQHSLRQVSRGTGVSFNSAEKQAFYDALFHSPLGHVTVLRGAGKLLACHYGLISKGVLYLGAPSFDVRERQYSPGLLLVLSIMKRSAEWGIAGFDLTIGEGDLKERCSTTRVSLPLVELYPQGLMYWRKRAELVAVHAIRRVLGDERWTKDIRPYLVETIGQLLNIFRMPPMLAARYVRETVLAPVWQRTRTVLFWAEAPVNLTTADGTREYRLNEIYDLLLEVPGAYAKWRIMTAAGKLPAASQAGSDFHTLVVNGRLAGWGFSRILEKETESGVDGVALQTGEALLHDFEMLPGFEHELSGFLADTARRRFAQGASRVALVAVNPRSGVANGAANARFAIGNITLKTRWPWREKKQKAS